MLGIKRIDKFPNLEIREKPKVNYILEEITKLKWKWAGHIAHMKDNRLIMDCQMHIVASERPKEIEGKTKKRVGG